MLGMYTDSFFRSLSIAHQLGGSYRTVKNYEELVNRLPVSSVCVCNHLVA